MLPLSTTFRQTLSSNRMLWVIYGITLILGLVAALPFYNTLKVEDQNSLAFLSLLNGFDYTVYSDFMHRSERAVAPLLSVGRWLGLLYLFLSVYFAGGILLRFTQPNVPFNAGAFWQGCSHYIWRFLRVSGVTLLFVVVGAGLWLVIGSLIGVSMSDSLTERGQFWIGAIFFLLFVITATFLLCIGDYAKVILFCEDKHNAFRAFGQASRLIRKNMSATYGLYFLLILIGTGFFGLYFLIDRFVQMEGWLTILFMLLIQQSLIFVRVGLKVWSLGVAYTVYQAKLRSVQPLLATDTTTLSEVDPQVKTIDS